MDWGNDYFTFSDTNIEYIWRFLKIVNERGWLYMGHRSTEWCPRCGTSLSQHELTQSASTRSRATRRCSSASRSSTGTGESVVVWTTTPWTLPANVAAAVNPEASTAGARTASGSRRALPRRHVRRRVQGSELVGLRYRGPFDDLAPGAAVEHRVIPWDEVTIDEGTGIVHIAPGCGGEDFELGRSLGLPVLTPVDESGRFYDDYGWLHGLSTTEAADQIVGDLGERGFLVESGTYCTTTRTAGAATRRSSSGSPTTGSSPSRSPPKLLEENAKVEWVPEYMGKRMDDWLRNMGDWNISRRRYYGLPLPFYPCCVRAPERDRLEGRARASARSRASTSSRSCAGRGSTACRSAARPAARP